MENRIIEIVNVIAEINDLNKIEKYNGEISLRKDLGFDSLALAELTVRIEDEFNIDIFEDGIVDTLEEILQKIKR